VQLLGTGDAYALGERVHVEGRGLLGVLPVPEVLALLQAHAVGVREAPVAELPSQVGGDQGIVISGGAERLQHQLAQRRF